MKRRRFFEAIGAVGAALALPISKEVTAASVPIDSMAALRAKTSWTVGSASYCDFPTVEVFEKAGIVPRGYWVSVELYDPSVTGGDGEITVFRAHPRMFEDAS